MGSTPYAEPQPEKKPRNTLAIVALIVAIIGFIFACVPGALIVGWILLPIAFILSIVSLFMKGKKGLGVTALVVSIVGTIVGVFVFIGLMGSAFNESFSEDELTAGSSASEQTPSAAQNASSGSDDAGSDEGTRANPYPLGTAVPQGDWTVTVNSTTLDANDAVLAENPYNEAPAEGSQYMLANITATYNGNDPEGSTPWVDLEYVTAEGNTLASYDASAVIPERFDSVETLYQGASTTGNYVFEVPSDSAAEGVLAVTPDMFGDKAFVAVQ